MGEARAIEKGLRISTKDSILVCDLIRRKNLKKAKNLLNNLLNKKISIGGKYYTKAVSGILSALNSAEANAKQKNLNVDRLYVAVAKADKGYRFIRPKSRAKFAGRKAKVTNITIVLKEK